MTSLGDSDRAAIDRVLDAWARAYARGDAAALTALVTEDAEFWTHGVPPLVGRSAVKTALASFFDRFSAVQHFVEHERHVAGDWAFARGEEISVLTPKEGGVPIEHRQRAFTVLRRDADGQWRFARGMTNQGPRPEPNGR